MLHIKNLPKLTAMKSNKSSLRKTPHDDWGASSLASFTIKNNKLKKTPHDDQGAI
jgi:hypothetical protein